MEKVFALEHRSEPVISTGAFVWRVLLFALIAVLILAISLGVGIWGYMYFAGLSWIDSLLNASMILTGMGPVNVMTTYNAKMFASIYAIYSGVAFLSTIGIFLTPLVHRLLHTLHVDYEE